MDEIQTPQDKSLADPLPAEPFELLTRWLHEARQGGTMINPDAMSVSTVDADGAPWARTVLCRGIDPQAGTLTFFTNRNSIKGQHLRRVPRASALFYWDALSRQVCAAGPVELASEAESDAYWASRPRLSQLAAWGSAQSEPVPSRTALLAQVHAVAERFGGIDGDGPVPRPPHWGGYRIVVLEMELWVGALGRIHDRVRWRRSAAGGAWTRQRLQP
jgi:pyridoxamine 5'-phosphate oxidase